MAATSRGKDLDAPTIVKPADQDQSSDRLRLGLMVVLAAATALALVAYLVLALQWRAKPFLGVMVTHTMTVTAGETLTDSPWVGHWAGLENEDRILTIAGEPVTGDDGSYYLDVLDDQPANQPVTVTFERAIDGNTLDTASAEICELADGSDTALCTIQYAPGSIPEGDFLAYFAVPFISGLVVFAIGLMILRMRPNHPAALAALAACFLLSVYMVGLFDISTTHRLEALWLTVSALLGGTLITLGLVFPVQTSLTGSLRWLRFGPLALSIALAALIVSQYMNEAATNAGAGVQAATLATIVGSMILAALLFFHQRPHAIDAVTRDQANTVFIGVCLALVPALLWLTGRVFIIMGEDPPFRIAIEATMPFFITPAISLAYAVFQYRRFDTDRMISRGIAYGIMLAALVTGYFLLVLGASLFAADVTADDPFLIAVAVFAVSVMFIPVRTTLQRRIDAIYFRVRRNYQDRMEAFSQKLTSLTTEMDIIKAFQALLEENIQPSSLFVFLHKASEDTYTAFGSAKPDTDIHFGPQSGVVNYLRFKDNTIYLDPNRPWPQELRIDRVRLSILQARLITGIQSAESLIGFVSLGPPRSGNVGYNYEELRFINNVIGQIAVAVERAQVIGSLQSRVRELDVLSQVGQAVNFTIEFDDLLELISAQMDKLVPAPYFYIVLHDAHTDLLSYAFFLEEDERDREKEKKRWLIGQDLYSIVIRSSQPLLVNDYGEAMSNRSYRIAHESHLIKAWMAVPLIAGPRTLGVLAIGDSATNRTFSRDQLKIFSDIGALAATSLDKARLFSETNVRARQLEVLNDISRQMVAAEADVEMLLELITSSAVEILNAEAGSLLLASEDGSGDLEFKAAVGDVGKDLIGTRLPAGYGLAGEVAEKGQPIISNDTSQDERFDGDVAPDSFHTSSILAVPLIAKATTVGVLEVINKTDGTVFIEEDQELLATFASQAAIALENARLLRSTDEQLARRVRELEALERIDVELNRTLDLGGVAEITLRSALENADGTAGMIGIINDARSHMWIASHKGYEGVSLPFDLEEDWPLDQGIVKRVMRTRRPDLIAHEMAMDPDYVASLPGSLSQITVPMLSGDEIVAILILEKTAEQRFNLLDLDWVQRLAEHASVAIANAQLYTELTHANESKSEFVAFAAHELKNPLTSVKGYAATLNSSMAGALNSEQIRQFASVIQSNADRMQSIIDDLRDIAASDAGKFQITLEPTAFRSIVSDTLIPFNNQLEEKRQAVIINVADDLPMIMGDHKKLIQVLTNFISNAHKYSPPDTTITIEAHVEDRWVNQKNQMVGRMLHVWVGDEGIGMNQEDLSRIFKEDYFRSTNPRALEQKGTGLGMMITQRIIQGHNGEVWLESTLGEGTTFHFVIPAISETASVRSQPEREPASD
jgi:signal transduction histidine kinase